MEYNVEYKMQVMCKVLSCVQRDTLLAVAASGLLVHTSLGLDGSEEWAYSLNDTNCFISFYCTLPQLSSRV